MKIVAALVLFFHGCLLGQNLVSNPSFETTTGAMNGFTIVHTDFNAYVSNWTTVNIASPDLITPSFKAAYFEMGTAHNGKNMVGIQSFIGPKGENQYAEYVGSKLTKELVPNKTYYVEYWIRRAKCVNPSFDVDQKMNPQFGIYFYQDTLKTSAQKMVIGKPQVISDQSILITDKKWEKISAYFTANTKYNKLCIGQFWQEAGEPSNLNGYYLIDDIVVEEVKNLKQLEKRNKVEKGMIIPLNHIHFVTGTTKLSDKNATNQIKELVSYLKANPTVRIRINGHTDDVGMEETNLILSKERATTIANRIIQSGIDKSRIEHEGYGATKPVDDNATDKGKANNRRVEFEVIGQ